jgi:hypothetical protein
VTLNACGRFAIIYEATLGIQTQEIYDSWGKKGESKIFILITFGGNVSGRNAAVP